MVEYRLKEPVKEAPKDAAKDPITTANESTPIKEEVPKSSIPDAVEYFGIEGWGQLLLEPKLDVYGLKDKVVYIDQFIKGRASELGLKGDRESYDSIMKELEGIIGTGKKTTQEQRITRIYEVIKTMMNQKAEQDFKNRALKSLLIEKK